MMDVQYSSHEHPHKAISSILLRSRLNMKIYTTLFIALVAANNNNGRLTNVSAAAVASDSFDGAAGSQPHLRALTDLSSQNATDTNATDTNATAPVCMVTNDRGGATCNSDSDCLSGICVPGATSQECSRCCGQHPGGACNAAGEGCNAQYGGSCDFTRNFTMGEEVIHGCYKCVHNDEDEEEMDVDTPSLRASILKEE